MRRKNKNCWFCIAAAIVALIGIAAAVAVWLNRRCEILSEELEEEDLVEYLEETPAEEIPEE